ncbi:MAG: hypothetical protein AB7O26_02715 [Planctomycetaceae bacterium]
MKLATAYVEIAARTDEFRRQLHDASRLAEQTGRSIARSLQADELPQSIDGVDATRRNRGDAQTAAAGRSGNAESGVRSLGPRWPQGTPRLFSQSPGTLERSGEDTSRERDANAILKQQLELARKEIDILQKQLDVLKEIRHGVPAVLT